MFKKLHYALFVLFAFVFISCNFTFNQPEAQQSTSITVTCGNGGSRAVSNYEINNGELVISLLNYNTNDLFRKSGSGNSTFYFDNIPVGKYYLEAIFYVNGVQRAIGEVDEIELTSLETKKVSISMQETGSRNAYWATYPEVISDWVILKNEIEKADSDYNCYKLGNELIVSDTITVGRKIRLTPSDGSTYIKVDNSVGSNFANKSIFEINTVEGAELVINKTGSSDLVTIDGLGKETSKPLIVNRSILTLDGVVFQNAQSTENGGAIENTGDLNLKNCNFSNCVADKGAGIYMTRGELTIAAELESSFITTETLYNETNINEVIYIISDANQCKLVFTENCMPTNVVMYIQNNANPVIVNDNGYEGDNSKIYFGSKISATEYADITDLFDLIYPAD